MIICYLDIRTRELSYRECNSVEQFKELYPYCEIRYVFKKEDNCYQKQ